MQLQMSCYKGTGEIRMSKGWPRNYPQLGGGLHSCFYPPSSGQAPCIFNTYHPQDNCFSKSPPPQPQDKENCISIYRHLNCVDTPNELLLYTQVSHFTMPLWVFCTSVLVYINMFLEHYMGTLQLLLYATKHVSFDTLYCFIAQARSLYFYWCRPMYSISVHIWPFKFRAGFSISELVL